MQGQRKEEESLQQANWRKRDKPASTLSRDRVPQRRQHHQWERKEKTQSKLDAIGTEYDWYQQHGDLGWERKHLGEEPIA